MEQHTPYLVWICLSVHNRSHSMEQAWLRNVGLDERSLRKAVGLIFRSAGNTALTALRPGLCRRERPDRAGALRDLFSSRNQSTGRAAVAC